MVINTRLFGEIEIDEKNIIYFKEGIPGFDEYKKYVLLNIEESNLKCIQSIDEKDICIVLITPWDYFNEYELELSDDELNDLDIKEQSDILIYCPVTIREDRITANLVAPIVINMIKNKGKQTILQNTKYSIRQEIKCFC